MEFSMILNYLFIGHVKIERLGVLSVFNSLHSSALWSLDSVCVEVGGGWTDGEYYLSGSRSITTPYSSKEQNNNAKLPMRYLCSNLFELSTLTIGLSSNRSSFKVYDTMQCERSSLHAFVFSLKPILSPKRISVLLLILLCSTFATQRNSHKSRNYDNDML